MSEMRRRTLIVLDQRDLTILVHNYPRREWKLERRRRAMTARKDRLAIDDCRMILRRRR